MIPFVPGGRRRDPEEDAHLRARSLLAERLDMRLADPDQTWLDAHLLTCDACMAIGLEYEQQAEMLRALPKPDAPRDLWARTRAAIELESGQARTGPRRAIIPLGALSGVLVVAVVVGASLLSQPTVGPVATAPSFAAASLPAASAVAPQATPITVAAAPVGWVLKRDDGTYALSYAPVDEVCSAASRPDCPPLQPPAAATIVLSETPRSVVASPVKDQVVVVDAATRTSGGSVLAVPLASPQPSPGPTTAPSPSPIVNPSPSSSPSPIVSPSPTSAPSGTPTPSAMPSPSPSSTAPFALASDVIVVGEAAAYSPDGQWFAFSARPADGTQGPDIYLWHVGDDAARTITDDHRSIFSGWVGERLIESEVVPMPAATPSPTPESTPDATVDPSPDAAEASPSPDPAGSPTDGSPAASADPASVPAWTAVSFLVDPATGARATLDDVGWRPVIDPSGAFAVSWEGTIVLDPDGVDWHPGAGQLVLTAFEPSISPTAPSPEPSASAGPSTPQASAEASLGPSSDQSPAASPSPDPLHLVLTAGAVADWDAHWDYSGTRLAIWVASSEDPGVGALTLHMFDPAGQTLDVNGPALAQVPALAGYSITSGRLAWATPPGQDGEGSHLQVLAWKGSELGQVSSEPDQGSAPVIVVR
jgi:hypothetical protein